MKQDMAHLAERAPHPALLERRRVEVVALCASAVALILVMHYTAALHELGVHDALRRLFYLPVILAAMAAGTRGGIGIAAFAVIGYLPHLRQLARADSRVMDSAVELVLLLVIGGLVGGYADASRRARAQAAERGRLAALGETGLALMAQTEGPLAAIEGQAESLIAAFGTGSRSSVVFAGQVIREEAARARHLLNDLAEMSRISEPRRERVDLPPLMERIIRDVVNARQDGQRVILIDHPKSCAIEADRRAVAFSVRALIFGLLDSVPPPGWLELRIAATTASTATVELGVFSLGEALPDLEESLTRVFGAGAGEYRFRQVLCVRLLASLGATVRFQRVSPCHTRIMIGFTAMPSGLHAENGALARGHQKEKHVKSPSLLVGSLLVVGLLAVTGCAAGTKLRGTWHEPEGGTQPIRHVMIIHATRTGGARRVFEDRFAAALRARGVEGEASYAMVGDNLLDSARVDMEVHKGHCDGILVTKVLDDETVRSYYRPAGQFASSRGQSWSRYSRNQTQVIETRVIDMETRLYRVSDGKLLWSGLTRSSFPKSNAPEKQIDPMVKRLVASIEKAGVGLAVQE